MGPQQWPNYVICLMKEDFAVAVTNVPMLQISLSVTVMLALTVFLLLVAESLPTQSDSVPLIGQYTYSSGFCDCFTCRTLCEFSHIYVVVNISSIVNISAKKIGSWWETLHYKTQGNSCIMHIITVRWKHYVDLKGIFIWSKMQTVVWYDMIWKDLHTIRFGYWIM